MVKLETFSNENGKKKKKNIIGISFSILLEFFNIHTDFFIHIVFIRAIVKKNRSVVFIDHISQILHMQNDMAIIDTLHFIKTSKNGFYNIYMVFGK